MPEFAMKLAVCWPKGNEGYLLLADDLCFQTSLQKVRQRQITKKRIIMVLRQTTAWRLAYANQGVREA